MSTTGPSRIENGWHELLLGLAGRVGDTWLWRWRDWLGAGATGALGQVVPLTLAREGVGLTAAEFTALVDLATGHGTHPARLLSIPELPAPPAPRHVFTDSVGDKARAFSPDQLPDELAAALAGAARTWWTRWRGDPRTGQVKRMLLVHADPQANRPAQLAARLGRALHDAEDPYPAVEVLTAPDPERTSPYHAAALAAGRVRALRGDLTGDGLGEPAAIPRWPVEIARRCASVWWSWSGRVDATARTHARELFARGEPDRALVLLCGTLVAERVPVGPDAERELTRLAEALALEPTVLTGLTRRESPRGDRPHGAHPRGARPHDTLRGDLPLPGDQPRGDQPRIDQTRNDQPRNDRRWRPVTRAQPSRQVATRTRANTSAHRPEQPERPEERTDILPALSPTGEH